jgi:hypothetical protein
MQQDSKDIAAVATATSMKTLSRRQLLDRSVGIGALLLTAVAARADDAMHGMNMSHNMDMSPRIEEWSQKHWCPPRISCLSSRR